MDAAISDSRCSWSARDPARAETIASPWISASMAGRFLAPKNASASLSLRSNRFGAPADLVPQQILRLPETAVSDIDVRFRDDIRLVRLGLAATERCHRRGRGSHYRLLPILGARRASGVLRTPERAPGTMSPSERSAGSSDRDRHDLLPADAHGSATRSGRRYPGQSPRQSPPGASKVHARWNLLPPRPEARRPRRGGWADSASSSERPRVGSG